HALIMITADMEQHHFPAIGIDLAAMQDVSPAIADRHDPRSVAALDDFPHAAVAQFLIIDVAGAPPHALIPIAPLHTHFAAEHVDQPVADLAHDFARIVIAILTASPARFLDPPAFLAAQRLDFLTIYLRLGFGIARGRRLGRLI